MTIYDIGWQVFYSRFLGTNKNFVFLSHKVVFWGSEVLVHSLRWLVDKNGPIKPVLSKKEFPLPEGIKNAYKISKSLYYKSLDVFYKHKLDFEKCRGHSPINFNCNCV